jgi:hypothetical protein
MKNSIITIILALCLIQVSNLQAQDVSYDAEYISLVKEFTLHEDGSYDFHYHKEIKLLTHFSFHRLYGETFIVYNPEYQELKINEAYTVMADGKKIITPENAFNEVLPGFARDIPAYNHLREMVVTHTGTEIGCVITLDYTIKTKQAYLPFFFGSEEIGELVPVRQMSLIVNVPVNIDLKHRMLNLRTAPEVAELAGQRTYTWNFRDVPALAHSGNQDVEQKATLFFSAAKDMTRAFYSFVNQEAFKSPVSPEINRRVEAVTKNKKNDLDIILGLQEVVIDEVKYADIPLLYSGYKVRTPSVVWQSANATSLEKAILLSEMLKAANINACPVATVPNGWYSSEMGNLAVFDGYMVQVNPKETGRIYLSVTQKQSQNLIYDVQDKTMIQLDGAIESMRTFKEKPNPNTLEMEAKIRLYDDKTVGGELEMEVSGICNPYFKLRKDSSYVKNMISGDFPASSIKTIEQDQLAELKSKYTLTNDQGPVTSDFNGFLYLELPRFKTGFDAWNLAQFAGAGNTPVRLDFLLEESYSYQVSLPSDDVLFTPPADISIKNGLGEMEISISQSGQTVKIERSWELYKDVISPDLMDEFKEMILAWEKVDYRKIAIRAK